MSHTSRIRRQPEPPQPIVWWHVGLGFMAFLILVGAVYLTANWIRSLSSTRETATGTILEIRKVVDDTRETLYGGKIDYRLEARVQYLAGGQMQDRWLRASDDLTQDTLLLKIAAHPTKCLVYWPPNHPENAKCSLK